VETHNEGHAIDRLRIEQFKKQFGSSPAEIPIESLREWIVGHKWENGTANRYKTVLSLIYRLGMENGKVGSNPARLLKRLKESDGRVRFLNQYSPDEEERLRKVTMARFAEHLPELDIALNTGMRRSEQYRRINWNCVDLQRQDLLVPKSKNGRPRHIPLNDAALGAFRELYRQTDGQDPIFASQRSKERLLGPRHWFEDAIQEAGVKDFTWHDLRQPSPAGWSCVVFRYG
jgi:integrase